MSRFPNGTGGRECALLGFGNNLWKGVKEMVDKKGFIGIFLGGFKNCAAGLSAALVFSYIASLLCQPKMKKALANLENSVV